MTVDIILAWLIAEDDGAKKKITALLADRDEDLSVIRQNIQGELLFYQSYLIKN
jgi:beta-catenin-like protein 1